MWGQLLQHVKCWNLRQVPLVETVHRTYQPSRILAFADDVPIGQGRGPIDGKPAAYVCRNRTCEAPLTSAEALRERFST